MESSSDLTGPLFGLLLGKGKGSRRKALSKVCESLVCSICQEYMYVPMMIQCGHNFCYGCLSIWFDSNHGEQLSCPHCRGIVNHKPCLNSALQQWLHVLIDVVKSEKEERNGKGALPGILQAKQQFEDQYRQDVKNDELFKCVFQSTATGLQDEDDEGILRCSNCHWELEDVEDGACPHCHARIRSGLRPDVSPPESDYSDYSDESQISEEGETWRVSASRPELFVEMALKYVKGVENLMKSTDNVRSLLTREQDPEFPFKWMKSTLDSGVNIYFPSYSLYMFLKLSPMNSYRERVLAIQREQEELEGSERDEFMNNRDEEALGFLRVPVNEYGKSGCKYESSARQAAETLIREHRSVPSDPWSFEFPFSAQRILENGDRILFPKFTFFIDSDMLLSQSHGDMILIAMSHMESSYYGKDRHIAERGFQGSTSQSEDDDSIQDFIASEDDEEDAGGRGMLDIVDLDAEERSPASVRSGSDEPDSDYFEHHEGDGRVSGDSLDDRFVETEPSLSEEDWQDESEDEEDGPRVHFPRKKKRAIVEASDDDSE